MEPEYPLTSLPTMAATRKLTKKNRCISSTCLVPVRHQVFGKKHQIPMMITIQTLIYKT